jgi:hypothetical protein
VKRYILTPGVYIRHEGKSFRPLEEFPAETLDEIRLLGLVESGALKAIEEKPARSKPKAQETEE